MGEEYRYERGINGEWIKVPVNPSKVTPKNTTTVSSGQSTSVLKPVLKKSTRLLNDEKRLEAWSKVEADRERNTQNARTLGYYGAMDSDVLNDEQQRLQAENADWFANGSQYKSLADGMGTVNNVLSSLLPGYGIGYGGSQLAYGAFTGNDELQEQGKTNLKASILPTTLAGIGTLGTTASRIANLGVGTVFGSEAGYDMYKNGVNLNNSIQLGLSTLPFIGSSYKMGKALYNTGRVQGLYDELKYGIYDRLQGWNIYRNMPSATNIHAYSPYGNNAGVQKFTNAVLNVKNGTATATEAKLGTSSPKGITISEIGNSPSVADNATGSFTFFGPYNYLNTNFNCSSKKPWNLRSWRLGFTSANKGEALPKSLVEASRSAVENAPSGSFIGADATSLTIPLSIENKGFWHTMLHGHDDPNKTVKTMLEMGPDEGTKISPDAYRWFTLEGQKPGNTTVYAGKSPGFNNSSVQPKNVGVYNEATGDFDFTLQGGHNAYIKTAEDAYNAGNMTAKEYVDIFNNWSKSFGGRPAHVNWLTGKPYIYHPTIYKNFYGGKLKKYNDK